MQYLHTYMFFPQQHTYIHVIYVYYLTHYENYMYMKILSYWIIAFFMEYGLQEGRITCLFL